MNGIVRKVGTALALTAAAIGGQGCYHYRDLVDPCYPQRYNYMARKEVKAAFAPQVYNGHVLDQTIWNYHFEPGTDRLTAGGLEHLSYIARRRPTADPTIYLQTAQDLMYDPSKPEKLAENREDIDHKRILAIQKYMTANTAGQCAFNVKIHDPGEVGLNANAVNSAVQQMNLTRFRGGLATGGGAGFTGGAGAQNP